MKISGITTLFVERKVSKNPVDNTEKVNTLFTTTISRKGENGSYTNCSMDIRFSREKFPQESLDKLDENKAYKLNILDGFLSVRTYNDKEGKEHRVIYIQVEDGKLEGSKEIQVKKKSTSDLPF